MSFAVSGWESFFNNTFNSPLGSKTANSTSATLKAPFPRRSSSNSSLVYFSFFKLSSSIFPSFINTVDFLQRSPELFCSLKRGFLLKRYHSENEYRKDAVKNFESSPVDTWAAMSPIVIPAMYSKRRAERFVFSLTIS